MQAAGFTVKGREWIANGFCSALISVLTFKVYANMTRFEWAYPSGTEHEMNQWISGQTMTLNCVMMNMVYVICETRCRVGEPGINDPNVKLVVTAFTYIILWGLQDRGYHDPTVVAAAGNASVVADLSDTRLPLKDVCLYQARAATGFVIFAGISAFSLGFVIFATSQQTLAGLRAECLCCAKDAESSAETTPEPDVTDVETPRLSAKPSPRRQHSVVDAMGKAIPVLPMPPVSEQLKGKLALFALFYTIVRPPQSVAARTHARAPVSAPSLLSARGAPAPAPRPCATDRRLRAPARRAPQILIIVIFFTFFRLYPAPDFARDDAAWRGACDANDQTALEEQFGLS